MCVRIYLCDLLSRERMSVSCPLVFFVSLYDLWKSFRRGHVILKDVSMISHLTQAVLLHYDWNVNQTVSLNKCRHTQLISINFYMNFILTYTVQYVKHREKHVTQGQKNCVPECTPITLVKSPNFKYFSVLNWKKKKCFWMK